MYVSVLVLFLFIVIIYLSVEDWTLPPNFLDNKINTPENNPQSLILFLTQHTNRVDKNYNSVPEGHTSSFYNVYGKINGNHVVLNYRFPLLRSKISQISLRLFPEKISSIVDSFGIFSHQFKKNSDETIVNLPQNPDDLNKFGEEIKNYGFLIKGNSLDINYKKLVLDSMDFSFPFAVHINNELKRYNEDTYFNRVQAVLNFVQNIPYGVPDFDKNGFFYFGLALPPESFILNYSDCDSKSVFFASILAHLIDSKNIILVSCLVSNNDNKQEYHMMVGIYGLGIASGQHVKSRGKNFHLLETTIPAPIGDWHWNTFKSLKIDHL